MERLWAVSGRPPDISGRALLLHSAYVCLRPEPQAQADLGRVVQGVVFAVNRWGVGQRGALLRFRHYRVRKRGARFWENGADPFRLLSRHQVDPVQVEFGEDPTINHGMVGVGCGCIGRPPYESGRN